MYEVIEDAAGCVYIMKDGEHTDAPIGNVWSLAAMEYLVNLLNAPTIQTQVISAMREDHRRRRAIVSDIFPHKVLGIPYPAWITDWANGGQSKFAIDQAGYNQWGDIS